MVRAGVARAMANTAVHPISPTDTAVLSQLSLPQMQRLFKGRLGEGAADAQLALKYRDDEGDLISITDDLDISHALSISPVLKIVVATGATSRSESSGGGGPWKQGHVRYNFDHLNDRAPVTRKAASTRHRRIHRRAQGRPRTRREHAGSCGGTTASGRCASE